VFYTYDPEGNLETLTYPDGKVVTYTYDGANRLTTLTPTPPTRTYAPPSATMTYDVDNRLIAYNGQSVASDFDGNLLAP